MIICHQCQKSQPEGAIFCSECGAKLIDTFGIQTQSINPEPKLIDAAAFPTVDLRQNGAEKESLVTLHILKTGDHIPLVGQDDFTIGRMSEGQSIVPDIDLSPYNAYQEGVSRIHASLKVSEKEVSLVDLSSVNGTSINDAKIPPNVYYNLQNGDTVTLGRLKVQIIIGE
jgi:hypothetical protein